MFIDAVNASIPIIGVHYDDALNFEAVLKFWTSKKPMKIPVNKSGAFPGSLIYFTSDPADATPAVYHKMMEAGTCLVVLNPPDKHDSLIFNAGILPTPDKFIRDYVESITLPNHVDGIVKCLKGLTLKAASEICQLTMARTGAIDCKGIGETRKLIAGPTLGLEPVSTEYDFYMMPSDLKDWVTESRDYFLGPNTPQMFRPRGVMLYGFPGTGKSLAAKVIAREWNLPLFRLDISGLLTKWIGESERNMTNFLRSVEAEGPCVLLLDECEKLFSGDMEGTTKRMLAQLLWWLEEHRARVLTVGTSNHLESMPPEFYRPGRFDTTIFINKLTTHEAKEFAAHFYKAIMKVQPPAEHWKKIHTMFSPFDKDYQLSAADVTSLVLSAIKQNKWV